MRITRGIASEHPAVSFRVKLHQSCWGNLTAKLHQYNFSPHPDSSVSAVLRPRHQVNVKANAAFTQTAKSPSPQTDRRDMHVLIHVHTHTVSKRT